MQKRLVKIHLAQRLVSFKCAPTGMKYKRMYGIAQSALFGNMTI